MPEAASSLAPMLMDVGQNSFQPPSELEINEEAEQCIAVSDVLDTRRNVATVATVQRVQAASQVQLARTGVVCVMRVRGRMRRKRLRFAWGERSRTEIAKRKG